VVRVVLLLFDYNGQLLEHAICLVVLFFVTLLYCYCFLNEINGDGDGDKVEFFNCSAVIVHLSFAWHFVMLFMFFNSAQCTMSKLNYATFKGLDID